VEHPDNCEPPQRRGRLAVGDAHPIEPELAWYVVASVAGQLTARSSCLTTCRDGLAAFELLRRSEGLDPGASYRGGFFPPTKWRGVDARRRRLDAYYPVWSAPWSPPGPFAEDQVTLDTKLAHYLVRFLTRMPAAEGDETMDWYGSQAIREARFCRVAGSGPWDGGFPRVQTAARVAFVVQALDRHHLSTQTLDDLHGLLAELEASLRRLGGAGMWALPIYIRTSDWFLSTANQDARWREVWAGRDALAEALSHDIEALCSAPLSARAERTARWSRELLEGSTAHWPSSFVAAFDGCVSREMRPSRAPRTRAPGDASLRRSVAWLEGLVPAVLRGDPGGLLAQLELARGTLDEVAASEVHRLFGDAYDGASIQAALTLDLASQRRAPVRPLVTDYDAWGTLPEALRDLLALAWRLGDGLGFEQWTKNLGAIGWSGGGVDPLSLDRRTSRGIPPGVATTFLELEIRFDEPSAARPMVEDCEQVILDQRRRRTLALLGLPLGLLFELPGLPVELSDGTRERSCEALMEAVLRNAGSVHVPLLIAEEGGRVRGSLTTRRLASPGAPAAVVWMTTDASDDELVEEDRLDLRGCPTSLERRGGILVEYRRPSPDDANASALSCLPDPLKRQESAMHDRSER